MHGARGDERDTDAGVTRLERQRFGEAGDRELRSRVGRLAGDAEPAGDRADHDDVAPPALVHRRDDRPCRVHDARDVHREETLKQLRVRVGCGTDGADAGGGHEHVDRAEPGDQGAHGSFDRRAIGHVCGHRERRRSELNPGLLEAGAVSRQQADTGPAIDGGPGDGPPDAP